MNTASGFVLPVDKPAGPTSHDVVARVRRSLGIRRVGHTGTLDPFATGLMLICVGPATRISEYLTGMSKTYEAVAHLGVRTDTLDRDGEVVDRVEGWDALDAESVAKAFEALQGPLDQVPPQYSAKKVGGEAMHRKARRGEHVELAPRSVVVHEVTLTAWEPPCAAFTVRCSSGTYVRALARDAGDSLGVGAHLTGLRRISVGRMSVEGALGLDDLEDPARVERAAVAPAEALPHLARVDVEAADSGELGHGRPLSTERTAELGLETTPDGEEPAPVVVAMSGDLVAMGEVRAGRLWPRKVFRSG